MSSTSPDPAADQAPQPDHNLDQPAPAADEPTTAEPEGSASDEPVRRVVDVADPTRRRRAPRYGRFAVVGFLLGAVASLVLTLVSVSDDGITGRNLFFLLLLSLGSAGIVLGLVTALWADRRSLRKRR
ncbi:hypothetical protein [Georgenia sunbinii]|uniref:hypothetical protein n=1 Tax=Georgenia sunbinii TaxID=3117728 RepID=UPI002F26DE5B